MRSYILVSTIVFDVLTLVQLVRLFLRWPVYVAGVAIPLWASAIAAIVVGSLAIAGVRVLLKTRTAATAGTINR